MQTRFKTQNPIIHHLQRTHLTGRDNHKQNQKMEIKSTYQANGCQKKSGVLSLPSDKAEFKSTLVRRDGETHCTSNGQSHQEHIKMQILRHQMFSPPLYRMDTESHGRLEGP